MRDIHNKLEQVNALDIQSISSDTTTAGNIIDMQGFHSLEFLAQAGTVTDGDYAFKIEHGDDSGLSDAADVPADQLLGASSAGASDVSLDDTNGAVAKAGYIGNKRYVRLSLVSTSTTSGGTLGAQAVKSNAAQEPV